MDALELKSPHDGSTLKFAITSREAPDADFEIAIRTPFFSGRAASSTYLVRSPADLFTAMADEWTGWTRAKEWRDLEHRCTLSATSDRTGHVVVMVTLNDPTYQGQLRCPIQFEAGQLDDYARQVRALFEANAP